MSNQQHVVPHGFHMLLVVAEGGEQWKTGCSTADGCGTWLSLRSHLASSGPTEHVQGKREAKSFENSMKDINGNINGESTMASLEQFLSYGCMADIVEDQAWATIVIRAPLGKK